MNLTDVFIKRPVFASVLNIILVLVGMITYFSLTLREFPNISVPTIAIKTVYVGANPTLIEGFVTTPLERAVSSIDGVDYVTSSSVQGSSNISIFLKLGTDPERAISSIKDKIDSVRWTLPRDIRDPVIEKQDPNASPILYISFSSDAMQPTAISDYLTRVVQPQLSILSGVARVVIFGETRYAMRIWLDPERMAAQGIVASDILDTLERNNVRLPSGSIKGKLEDFNVIAVTDLFTAEQFNNLVVSDKNEHLIRIKDIGHAELGSPTPTDSMIMTGKKTQVVAIIPQSGANPLTVAEDALKTLETIKTQLPAGLTARVEWDSTKFISKSINEVFITTLEATVIVTLVIFLFVGSFRALAIPVITIPISLIGACIIMFALGFSLNTLTLLAWVLAIGLVVDDAIVVLENIQRHIELGAAPFDAAIKGAREIAFAVIAMTITLAAVYAPIGFKSDFTGVLFREFAFTLAGAVIVSGFIAITLSPMMCSKLLKGKGHESRFQHKVEAVSARMMNVYKGWLEKVFHYRMSVMVLCTVVILAGFYVLNKLPKELTPTADQGYFMTFITGPTSANLNYIEKYTAAIEPIYRSLPEMQGYGIVNGWPSANGGMSFVILKDWSKRKRSARELSQVVFPHFWAIPGILAFPVNPPSLPIGGSKPIEFVIKTIGSYQELESAAKILEQAAKKYPGLTGVKTDLKLNKPQIILDIDRNRASDLGISTYNIGQTLNLFLGEQRTTQFAMNGRGYDVLPRLYSQFMDNPNKLGYLNVRTASQELIPLDAITSITESVGPDSLSHFQQQRSATLDADVTPGYTVGQALDYLEQVVKKELPSNIQFDFAGQSRQFKVSSGGGLLTIGLAIVFIYLVLAAQFESYRDPFIVIMFSVPISLAWGIFTIAFLKTGTWNIYTEIALVTLIGLISKHGILIVEFANQLQEQGRTVMEAIMEASILRLRPILMTSGAIILGILPLAIASGAGSEARNQIGWTIVNGMIFGTIFTLFAVPIAYSYLSKPKKHHHVHVVIE